MAWVGARLLTAVEWGRRCLGPVPPGDPEWPAAEGDGGDLTNI
jgi:hypothetical protein